MTTLRSTLSLAVVAAACGLAACSSTPSNLQTATGDTKPQPVVVAVTTMQVESGCWVQFYDERGFKGSVATLVGPASLESIDKIAGKQIKKQIDSLVTGPKATLKVYEHAMFKDRSTTFGPNSREAGLITKLGIGGAIQSMQLDCDN